MSASIAIPMKGRTLWRWTAADVKRVKKFKTTNYRKGRDEKKGEVLTGATLDRVACGVAEKLNSR